MSTTSCECPVWDEAISASTDVESACPFSQDDGSRTDSEQIEVQAVAESKTTDRKADAAIKEYPYFAFDPDYVYDPDAPELYVRTRCYAPQLARFMPRD